MVLGMITCSPFNTSLSSTPSSLRNDHFDLSWFGSSLTRSGCGPLQGVVLCSFLPDVVQASLCDL